MITWKDDNGELKASMVAESGRETDVTWAPQAGSQEAFLACPFYEVLYEGTRGPGKTDALLMDFAQHVGQGHGSEWRGILFRRTFPELADIVAKSKKWFKQIWPQAQFNESKYTWVFPDGEELLFRHFKKQDDYWSYHGHAYPWIAWEELTTWPDSKCYTSMMACSRTTKPSIPLKYRATTNPYGVGHNWVKARWRLPMAPRRLFGQLIKEEGKPERIAIRGRLDENKVLLHADPDYISRIRAAARNPSELKAWLHGSWDVVAGGMFDDLWDPEYHVVPNIPLASLPRGWRINRAYDHGQSAPFSVGWWAESNGEPVKLKGRRLGGVPGDLFRISEWYGWNGEPNEGVRMLSRDIGAGIIERETDWGMMGIVKAGPADASIFDDYEPGASVAGDMKKSGVRWLPADKGPGSRKQGWEQMRAFLKGSKPGIEGVREEAGLFICERCAQFIRTFPVLPRSDKDLDDVDTNAEDHVADESRYRCRNKIRQVTQRTF